VKARVYLETSVISYLTARRSRDLITAAHQELTADWWERRSTDFDLFTSEVVIAEARLGDPEAARARLQVLQAIPVLGVSEEARALAESIIVGGILPPAAFPDALHMAVAAAHGIDYLLTWNCAHIANAEILPRILPLCQERGLSLPYTCTPEELLGGSDAQ
jgi:predicted nucleic acid-binding protein